MSDELSRGLTLRNTTKLCPLKLHSTLLDIVFSPSPDSLLPGPSTRAAPLFPDQQCQPGILANSLAGRGRGTMVCSICMVRVLPLQLISGAQCSVTDHRTEERRAQLVPEWAAACHSCGSCLTLILNKPALLSAALDAGHVLTLYWSKGGWKMRPQGRVIKRSGSGMGLTSNLDLPLMMVALVNCLTSLDNLL